MFVPEGKDESEEEGEKRNKEGERKQREGWGGAEERKKGVKRT